MRNTVFISHATPEDNDFTSWLSLQLVGLGYDVWCDVIKLKGGEDWWQLIEQQIREKTIKFLIVLSTASNNKDGVLKELAIANKVKKNLEDNNFIIPLHIDSSLSYDDVNVELIRLNSISFKKSWAEGLKTLLEKLEEDNVPKKANDYTLVKSMWENVFMHNKKPIFETETYYSNWFPIVEIPKLLRFHNFKFQTPRNYNYDDLPYPAVKYRDYLVTFAWCYDFMEQLPKTETYSKSESLDIDVEEILSGNYGNSFIQNKEARKLIVRLLNKAFDSALKDKASVYEMSGRNSFWIKKGVLEKDKYNKIQLVGKQKDKHWHYGVSGSVKLFPESCFVITSHIWFTSDGINLIPEASKQHASRRKQGKNWWNNDWRNKTIGFMQYLGDDGLIKLKLGSEEFAIIGVEPILFKSPVKYIDPNIENLPDEEFNDHVNDEIIE